VRKREVFGWAMYDFANSGYTTVVITAVFAAYFVGGIAQGGTWATFAWTAALSISYAIVMVTMPSHRRMPTCARPRSACWRFVDRGLRARHRGAARWRSPALGGPGDAAGHRLQRLLQLRRVAHGAFLPELAHGRGMGKVSGWGWGFGYFGGMLALGICLAYVLWAQAHGHAGGAFVPVTMLITAVIYGAAACVTFRCCASARNPMRRRGAASAPRQQLRAPSARRAPTATSCGCWPAPCATRAAWRWRSRWRRSMPSR
jgi:UMF1 family MFS transporter